MYLHMCIFVCVHTYIICVLVVQIVELSHSQSHSNIQAGLNLGRIALYGKHLYKLPHGDSVVYVAWSVQQLSALVGG